MFGKRGLSNLVATVLIVLLALAAVAIIWSFLKPAFDRGGQQIDLGSQCFSFQLNAESCKINSNSATLIVKLNSERGQYFTEMIGVFEDANGVTHVVNVNGTSNLPASLETKAIAYNFGSGSAPAKARVAGVLVDGTNRKPCPESATVVCA